MYGEFFKKEIEGLIWNLDVSSDGSLISMVVDAANKEPDIRIFDLYSGQEVNKFHVPNTNKAFFSADDKSLIIVKSNLLRDEEKLEIFNIETKKIEKNLMILRN